MLARKIKEARGNLTQIEVAKMLGISQAVLSKIESGVREPTAVELKKFAELYNKPMSFFFTEEEGGAVKFLRRYFGCIADAVGIEMVFLFGSFSKGEPRTSSDIDIGILFSGKKLHDEKLFDVISDLSLKLTYELKKEVNIVIIKANKWKPMFYYNIIILGAPLFIRDRGKYLSLRWEAIRQMEDFVAMGLAWQVAAARVNLRRAKYG